MGLVSSSSYLILLGSNSHLFVSALLQILLYFLYPGSICSVTHLFNHIFSQHTVIEHPQ